MTRCVGLFGGSFNPPHVCHVLTTLWALKTGGLDEVWWMPTYQHAFGKDLVEFGTRVTMCELALQGVSCTRVSQIERELGGESRTIDTVTALLERHPDCAFTLLVGADILAERHQWKSWGGLMELVDLRVIGRAGYEEDYAAWQHTLAEKDVARRSEPLVLPGVSSSRIRAALRGDASARESMAGWLIDSVTDFVQAHGLYTSEGERDERSDA